jgi:hypothetical protein
MVINSIEYPMKTKRLKRQLEVPAPFREEDYRKAARLPTIHLDDICRVEYTLSPHQPVGLYDVPLDELLSVVRRQSCDAWIFDGDEIAGGVQLQRYSFPAFADNEYIIDIMDMDSAEEYELASALADQFEDIGEEIGAYGDLVEINRVWIKPTSSIVGRSSDIVHALIGAFCPDFSTIVLKAYPLEYEQYREGSIGPALRASFKRRQLAMMRLYTRTYGVHAMDGARGTEGWMFRHRYA